MHIHYRRREWSWIHIALMLGICAALALFVYAVQDAAVLRQYASGALTLGGLALLMEILAYANIGIALKETDMEIRPGFFSRRRTVPYEDIYGIERVDVPLSKIFTSRERLFSQEPYYAPGCGPGFRVTLRDGDSFVVQSRRTDEILQTLKRIDPELRIAV